MKHLGNFISGILMGVAFIFGSVTAQKVYHGYFADTVIVKLENKECSNGE